MATIQPKEFAKRFALRPEIAMLYDRRHGLEHRLNGTALEIARDPFAPGLPRRLAIRYAISLDAAERAIEQFMDRLLAAPGGNNPARKSGMPASWLDTPVAFPLALELELTKVCNWHCDFCYNVWKVSDEFGRRSGSETAAGRAGMHLPLDRAAAVLREAAEQNCLRIRFSGGEPTLHPDFAEIVTIASGYGFDIELFTNGVRLDRERARWLVDRGVRTILVSIHGSPATHNRLARNPEAYRQAMGGLAAACEAGATTVAETLVCTDNVDDIVPQARVLADMGIKDLSLMPYVASGPADRRQSLPPDQLDALIGMMRTEFGDTMRLQVPCAPRHCRTAEPTPVTDRVDEAFSDHCAAGILWASVSHDGKLRHCPHSSVVAGDVSDGVAALWSERLRPRVADVLSNPPAPCGSCVQLDNCGGGCHLNRIESYDDAPAKRRLLPLLNTGTCPC